MKDAVETMGAILPDDAGGRDAVHVAVFSAVSERKLYPGDEVSLVEQEELDVKVARQADGKEIGIVDPFISGVVLPGERFWVYLKPRTITALSHRWSHPSFEEVGTIYSTPATKLTSEQWIRDWVEGADCPGYEAVMAKAAEIADDISTYGRADNLNTAYMHFEGRDASGEIPSEFWDHAEVVLGRQILGRKATYFSCSC